MTFLLGIDTGGTFTDAAILEVPHSTAPHSGAAGPDVTAQVIAKAKALTTRQDLATGIAEAADAVLKASDCDPSSIGLVSLSTTLATNALVEGQGGRVALVCIGFEERDLNNAGLAEALGQDPVVFLKGGHTTHGSEAQPLDMAPLEAQLDELATSVTGFAVAGYFAVRNPAHELSVRELILARTGKAVTCSHELSARLNGPKRALTTILNARLVPMITRLVSATQQTLNARNITAPVMVVRGDGALVSAGFAVRRPIETILSGPAASLVGAHFLTGTDKAVVNDIGGTTSDVAMLENGKPRLDPDGASVGGFQTMVEAVAMHTFGLGGDSEVHLAGTALLPRLELGPRRLVPVSLIAKDYPENIHAVLDKQLKSVLNGRYDGRFAFRSGAGLDAGLSASEAKLYGRLDQVPQELEGFLQSHAEGAALNKLVGRGLVMISGLTPSDAMHALEQLDIWDRQAAVKALRLFGRKRDGGGKPFCADPLVLAKKVIQQVQRRSAEIVLETGFQVDNKRHNAGKNNNGENIVDHALIQNILDGRETPATPHQENKRHPMIELSLKLDRPLIGLGASARAYHPRAAHLLGTTAIVPEHADVANAIGAVVGQIVMRAECQISQPAEGRFQVTGMEQPFPDEQLAFQAAEKLAREKVSLLAQKAGAGSAENDMEIVVSTDVKRATVESRDMLIEATVTAIATGRPPIVEQPLSG